MGKAAAPKAMKAMKRVNILAKDAAPKAMGAMKRVNILAKAAAPKAMKAMKRAGGCLLSFVRLGPLVVVPAPMCGCLRTVVERGRAGGKPQSTDSCSSVRPSLN